MAIIDPKIAKIEYDKYVDSIKVCGANRGPHDYIPITKQITKTAEHVTTIMCRVCFKQVTIDKIQEIFGP